MAVCGHYGCGADVATSSCGLACGLSDSRFLEHMLTVILVITCKTYHTENLIVENVEAPVISQFLIALQPSPCQLTSTQKTASWERGINLPHVLSNGLVGAHSIIPGANSRSTSSVNRTFGHRCHTTKNSILDVVVNALLQQALATQLGINWLDQLHYSWRDEGVLMLILSLRLAGTNTKKFPQAGTGDDQRN